MKDMISTWSCVRDFSDELEVVVVLLVESTGTRDLEQKVVVYGCEHGSYLNPLDLKSGTMEEQK